jgi:succinoglycan biosynthesis transport protein ExoP
VARLAEVTAQQIPTDMFTVVSVDPGSLSTADKLQLPASRALRITLGFLFGVVGALVLVAIVEKLNPRIDDPQHATDIVGAPVLAMVPVMGRRKRRREVLLRADPAHFRGPFAEAYRSARTHLDFRATADGMERPPRIMVTSATPAEGKSTTAAFLSLAFAEAGRPPVLVGGDLRRPSVHELFEVPRAPGLSSRAAMGGDAVPLSEIVTTDPTTRVSVVPAGPAVDRVTGLLGDLTAVTGAARGAGRVTVVDTAPVMIANDAVDFLVAVDWVIVVIRVGRSTERAVTQMMQSLNLNNANVVGVVMVGSLESSDAKRYYYSYYSDDDSDLSRPRRVAAPSSSDGSPTPTTGTIEEVEPISTTS